jgi:NADH-quinone oxidoreductase subunit I
MSMANMGVGILKGLRVTLTHFINTYIEDLRYAGRRYFNQDIFEERQGLKATGAYTVQYPEEKIAVPERFRFVPFLVVNDQDMDNPGMEWCTACGICSKVCPPQCIWIVQENDAKTGRPIPRSEAFYIDIDICMNCGYCAEFCPFDSIKMDHDYELASYDRTRSHIHGKDKLNKPFSYWRSIAPTRATEEAEARGGWEHKDVLKAKSKAAAAEAKKVAATTAPAVSTPASSATVEAVEATPAATPVASPGASTPEERKAKREAALAKKRASQESQN